MIKPDIPLKNAPEPLWIPTFEGSGQAVHPDIVKVGEKYVLTFTPYPFSNELYENPSVLVSNDGVSWSENGIKNPVIQPKTSDELTSDPDIVYVDGRFYLFYISWKWGGKLFKKARALMKQYTKQYFSKINIIISYDLKNWKQPIQIVKSGGFSSFFPFTRLIVSPSVTWDGKFRMWYVKVFGCTNTKPHVFYRESIDGAKWSREKRVFIEMPKNEVLWHIDVEKLSNGNYLMVIAAYPQSANCEKVKRLYLAFSNDGFKWTVYREPLLTTSSGGSWDSDGLYRSTFTIEKGKMHLWYTGLRDRVWRIGHTCSETPLLKEEVYSLNVVEVE
ncbi:MAG: hypothetical protein DRJ44_07695 [Thermoprotei archaeon]|nr:MAG: hypothetical protein DRJ44_07695 [Thermoprotei archaeon]